MISEQLLKGQLIEAEHQATYDWLARCFIDGVLPSPNAVFTHIAMDHLSENPDYYTELHEAGL